MRDFSKNEFFLIELSNSIIALISWYIAISFYLQYQIMSYLIATSVVFSINFVILMILICKRSYESNLLCLMKELFFLGFLNRQTFDNTHYQDEMINYSSIKSLFQLIINITFFFGVGQISDSQMKSQHVFLCYFLVLSQILRFASLGVLYSLLFEELPIILKLNNSFVYLVTVFSMIMFKDNYGFNLGYYQLILVGVCIIISLYVKYAKKCDVLDSLTFSIITNIQEQLDQYDGKFLLCLAYGCQIVRVILLSVFGFTQLEDINQSPIYYYEVLRHLNLFIALLGSLPYFIHNFYIFLSYIKKNKFIEIRSMKDVQVLKTYVQQRHLFLKNLKINARVDILKSEDTIMGNNENIEPLIVDEQEQNIYLFYFQIFQCISDFEKIQQNVNIEIKCDIHLFNNLYLIISNIENLHKKLINQLKIQKHQKQIISKRFENGFLFNNSTQLGIQNLSKQAQKACYEMISQTLSVQMFNKNLRSLMTFSPNQIIFDLYSQQ